MKVLKFGGTSVGTVESLRHVKKIVDSIPGRAVVVVSALGGLTDKLIATAKKAAEGEKDWNKEYESMVTRHHQIIDTLFDESQRKELKEIINPLLSELKRNYEGVELLRILPDHILDVIVSFGERISSHIVAALIENGKRHDSLNFIKTEKWFDKNTANRKLTESLIQKEFEEMKDNEKAIVPGFISTDSTTGQITNLGRGGSDYTGALIAAALDSEILEIWTDVDGFMTADPRIVKDAIVIDHLTFTESMELCTFGAKVIYPPTIYPVFHKNIPIKILNTFNYTAPGTLITDNRKPEDLEVKGVTSLKGVSLVSIEILKSNLASELTNRAFNALSKQGISIIPVANPDPGSELSIGVSTSDVERSLKILTAEFAPEVGDKILGEPKIKSNLSALAIVGDNMRGKSRLAARIGHSLRRQGINVEAFSVGNSDSTIIFIVAEEKTPQSLTTIHSLIYQ